MYFELAVVTQFIRNHSLAFCFKNKRNKINRQLKAPTTDIQATYIGHAHQIPLGSYTNRF